VNLPKYGRNDALRFGKKRVVVNRAVWNPKGQQKQQLSFSQVVAGEGGQRVLGDAVVGGSGKSASVSREEGCDFSVSGRHGVFFLAGGLFYRPS